MALSDPEFVPFLLRAKKATYASGTAAETAAARPASHDLSFRDGSYTYLDTYLGGFAFLGEEAVWENAQPVWGMNYYGTMTVEDAIPEGFGDFLKLALRHVHAEAPFRGPARFDEGRYSYTCQWEGGLALFRGEETIALDGQVIYQLYFHGGVIQ